MFSRHRQSGMMPAPGRASAVPTATPGRRPGADEPLPPYKKPSHPLNERAQAKLRALNDRSTEHVKGHSRIAGDRIAEAAALVIDRLHEREVVVASQRLRWQKGVDTESQEQDEARLAELQAKVEDFSKQLEVSMRAVIDNGVAARRIEDSLEWLRTHAPGQLEREYQTQRTQQEEQRASQSQRRRTQDEDGDEDMQDGQETQLSVGPTPGPTPLDGSRPSLTGAFELYTDHVQREKDRYTSTAFVGRYSRNEAYHHFKKMVHDAKYHDEQPLPPPDTWFTESGSPAPGVTGHGRDHEDDDDIVMERVTISTKCPLTLQTFKDPWTSKKCPHTFEKDAITEMIRKSAVRVGGGVGRNGGGERAVECPVAGCSHVLTREDLRPDPIIIRKIKRMQQEAAREDSDFEEEQEASLSQQPTRPSEPQIKADPSSRSQASVTQQPPQSSIVDDLGDPSDEDDE